MHDEPAFCMIERAHYSDFLGLAGASTRRSVPRLAYSQIGMSQRLAFITEEQDDVASVDMGIEQLEHQTGALDLGRDLPPLQCVPRPAASGSYFRNAFDNCNQPSRLPFMASAPHTGKRIVPNDGCKSVVVFDRSRHRPNKTDVEGYN